MSARDIALIDLDRHPLPHWPAGALRAARRPARQAPAHAADPALARQIHHGVVKNLLLLQHLIEFHSGRGLRKIDPLAQKILAIALFQIRFLDRIPAAAAVDEAIKQMKRFGHANTAKFVNAVLRRATSEAPPQLPAQADDPEQYVRLVLSHPPELFAKLKHLLGDADALRFCRHSQAQAPTLVRLIGPTTIQQLRDAAGREVGVEPHRQAGLCVVTHAKQPLLADLAQRGLAQVQDATAASVVPALGVEPGQTILDRCCGMGTKTLQLHEMMTGQGRLIAMDSDGRRCQILRQLADQRGLKNIEVVESRGLSGLREYDGVQFDRILIDAPCSNSGVLARRPEARFAQTAATLASLVKLQDWILRDTAPRLRPGGKLVYSTCSIWPEENRQRIDQFLESQPELALEQDAGTLPSLGASDADYHDGGYWARLRRRH